MTLIGLWKLILSFMDDLQGVGTEIEVVTIHVVAITGKPELGIEPEDVPTGITS